MQKYKDKSIIIKLKLNIILNNKINKKNISNY